MVSSCHVKAETYRLYWSLKNKNTAIYIIWTTLKRLEYGKAESKRIEKNSPTKYKSKNIRVAT